MVKKLSFFHYQKSKVDIIKKESYQMDLLIRYFEKSGIRNQIKDIIVYVDLIIDE
jgi:hypothetical protein